MAVLTHSKPLIYFSVSYQLWAKVFSSLTTIDASSGVVFGSLVSWYKNIYKVISLSFKDE